MSDILGQHSTYLIFILRFINFLHLTLGLKSNINHLVHMVMSCINLKLVVFVPQFLSLMMIISLTQNRVLIPSVREHSYLNFTVNVAVLIDSNYAFLDILIYLLQAAVPQASDISLSPLQPFPSHVLLFILLPPPHVTEHPPHAPHSPH